MTTKVQQALRMPIHVLARKVWRRLGLSWQERLARRREQRRSTYSPASGSDVDLLPLLRAPLPLLKHEKSMRRVLALAERYADHEFDLLGSGWMHVQHGMACRGVGGHVYQAGVSVTPDAEGRWLKGRINSSNLKYSKRRWQAVELPYTPLDWQIDFKSGFRWSEATRQADIVYGHFPGVDVKVPWELARMQQLPQMALAYGWTRHVVGDHELAGPFLREFRNQVLDFLATNPPGYGVNWKCTMDVAIRVTNWILAYDLFRVFGAELDPEFCRWFVSGIFDHAAFIAAHLEWNEELRGNHYLANVAGLLIAAAVLPASRLADAWMALGVHQLIDETKLQFHADGSNFEGSTAYHRLSSEMVVLATAVVLGLPAQRLAALEEYDHQLLSGPVRLPPAPLRLFQVPGSEHCSPFPPDHWERLEGMADFAGAITQPDARIVQIGDNDSGRFFRLAPGGLLDEDHLDHRALISAIESLFQPARDEVSPSSLDAALVSELSRHRRVLRQRPPSADHLVHLSYSAFGLFIYRSGPWWLAARCGSVGQNGRGGHAHNDQLSIVLSAGKRAFVIDPGTNVYTPLPSERNRFRGTASHNVFHLPGREQNDWLAGSAGLFRLTEKTFSRVLENTDRYWVGEHQGYGCPCRRSIRVLDRQVTGLDELPLPTVEKQLRFHLDPAVQVTLLSPSRACLERDGVRLTLEHDGPEPWIVEPALISPGYGVCVRSCVIFCRTRSERIGWTFTLEA